MKKILIALLMMFVGIIIVQARDEVYRDLSVLPQTAQQFIQTYFKHVGVSFIKVEKTFGVAKEYEVVLNDGTEIEFNRDGTWDKIEMPCTKAVPSAIVPKPITQYVNQNYPGQLIVSIDKESRKYEVELQNGLELIFDRAGNFKRIDD